MKKYIKIIVNIILICTLVNAFSSNSYATTTLKVADGGGKMGDIVSDAGTFLNEGLKENKINDGELKNGSSTLYNVLLIIGTGVAFIWGIVLGIQFVTGTVEDKADIKKNIIPYIIGCVIIFGAFGIWKLVLSLLEPISSL